jgi:hypothetical protein
MAKYKVVFVPGILGSTLSYENPPGVMTEVWSADLLSTIYNVPRYAALLHPSQRLSPTGVIERTTVGPLVWEDIYGGLLTFLKTPPLNYVHDQNLFAFAYDWRQSVFDSATRLLEFIEANITTGPIAIVAHSLGALVARAAIFKSPALANEVKKLIEIGPPHQGSSVAFQRLFELSPYGSVLRFLSNAGVPIGVWLAPLVCCIHSMPSFWQLLPPEKVLVNRQNPTNEHTALEWPGWADSVRSMLQDVAQRFHQHSDEIPKKWPGSVRTCLVFSRAFRTPHKYYFDPVVPYIVDFSVPVSEPDGDKIVGHWSAIHQYTTDTPVDYHHRIIARDPKTLAVLEQELL